MDVCVVKVMGASRPVASSSASRLFLGPRRPLARETTARETGRRRRRNRRDVVVIVVVERSSADSGRRKEARRRPEAFGLIRIWIWIGFESFPSRASVRSRDRASACGDAGRTCRGARCGGVGR